MQTFRPMCPVVRPLCQSISDFQPTQFSYKAQFIGNSPEIFKISEVDPPQRWGGGRGGWCAATEFHPDQANKDQGDCVMVGTTCPVLNIKLLGTESRSRMVRENLMLHKYYFYCSSYSCLVLVIDQPNQGLHDIVFMYLCTISPQLLQYRYINHYKLAQCYN